MAEQFISSIEKRVNGKDNFDTLCRHYSGKGNVSRRVATSDRLCETLHYNSMNALSLYTFLDRLQKMFNISCDEGEHIYYSMKVHELFRRVQ